MKLVCDLSLTGRPIRPRGPAEKSALELLAEKAEWSAVYRVSESELYQDAAATVPATTDGQTVRAIKPLAGGPTLTQSGGSVFGTLATDANGVRYIDMPGGSFLSSPKTYTVETGVFVGMCLSRGAGSSFSFGGMANDNANGLMVWNSTGAGTTQIRLTKTGQTTAIVCGRSGMVGFNVPFATQAYLDGATIQGMQDGAEHTPLATDFIALATAENLSGAAYQMNVAVTWPASAPLASCRIGVNTNGGLTGTTAACRFYGGVWAKGEFTLADQRILHKYLRGIIGHGAVGSAVYDGIIVAGQSNAQGGAGDTTGWQTATLPPVGAMIEGTWQRGLRTAVQPGDGNFATLALTSNAWTKMGADCHAATGRRMAYVNAAYGGRGLRNAITPPANWTPTGNLVERAALKYQRMAERIAAAGGSVTLRAVIWQGGENDFVVADTVATYKAALVDLRDRFRTATGNATLPLWIVSIDDHVNYTTHFAMVRQAQAEAAAENEGIELIVPYQNFRGQGMLADDVHLNAAAHEVVGAVAAGAIADLLT